LTKGHIYSVAAINNFRTNFLNVHPGEALFRYSFSSHGDGEQPEPAWKTGWNAANPPGVVWMKGPQSGSLPAAASFCQIDADHVMLLTWKRAQRAPEDGNGFILRLMETAGRAALTKVTLPHLSILHAYMTNLVEENQQLLPCAQHEVEVALQPFAIATIRVLTR
jgi:alpha-mannosidase